VGLFTEKPTPPLPEQETDSDPRTLALAVLALLREGGETAGEPLEIEYQAAE
jgi:hypothetical protein